MTPPRGRRFDAAKLLLDPYGRGGWLSRANYSREATKLPGDNTAYAMKKRWWSTRPATTGKAMPDSGAASTALSSMRCTSAALPSIPVPPCHPGCAAPTRG